MYYIHAYAYLRVKCESERCINLESYIYFEIFSVNIIFMKLGCTALQVKRPHNPVRDVNLLQVTPNFKNF